MILRPKAEEIVGGKSRGMGQEEEEEEAAAVVVVVVVVVVIVVTSCVWRDFACARFHGGFVFFIAPHDVRKGTDPGKKKRNCTKSTTFLGSFRHTGKKERTRADGEDEEVDGRMIAVLFFFGRGGAAWGSFRTLVAARDGVGRGSGRGGGRGRRKGGSARPDREGRPLSPTRVVCCVFFSQEVFVCRSSSGGKLQCFRRVVTGPAVRALPCQEFFKLWRVEPG